MDQDNQPPEEGMAELNAYQDALQRGDTEAMQAAAMQLMALACDQMEKNPSADFLLEMQAYEHEEAHDWEKAQEARRQVLALAEAESDAAKIFKAHYDLSGLYAFLGQQERALEEAGSAAEAARSANIPPLLAAALQNQAVRWLHLGEIAPALGAANEILEVLGDDKAGEIARAKALVLRARCYAQMREPTAARGDLDRAWALLTPMSGLSMFAGVQGGLAGWWEVTASLHSLDGDFAETADAWRKAVEYSRHVSQLPHLEGPYKFASLAETLSKLGNGLLAIHAVDEANEAFRESREIRKRIGLPEI